MRSIAFTASRDINSKKTLKTARARARRCVDASSHPNAFRISPTAESGSSASGPLAFG